MTFHGGAPAIWRNIGTLDQSAATALVARALEAGVNFIDTADVYSEGAVRGSGSARRLRDLDVTREDVIVATKVRGRMGPGPNAVGLSRGHIMDQIAASLKRLKLDHIDLYQIHGFDPVTPLEETLRALDDCVSRGLVRTIGCSNLAAWQIMKALGIADQRGYARFETVQAYYSIAGRDLEREIVPLVEDQGLGVMVWSPLAGGFLSGKYTRDKGGDNDARRTVFDFPPVDKERAYDIIDAMAPIAEAHGSSVARVALAWLLQRKGVMSVIIGAKTIEQLDDNLAAAELKLSPEEIGDARRRRARSSPNIRAGCSSGRRKAACRRRRRKDFRRPRPGGDLNGRGSDCARSNGACSASPRSPPRKSFRRCSGARSSESPPSPRAIAARRKRPRRQLGIPRAYGSYEELLADPEIEAIYNPLPNELHVPWTLKALAAGKHVLCEKPIALDAEEARKLIAARNRNPASWSPRRSWCVFIRNGGARASLRGTGRSAKRSAIQTFFSYRLLDPDNVRNRPPGGGGLYDIGCYAILTARYIFGAEPTRVVATIDCDPNFKTDRLASALLEFPGGRHLTFTAGTQSPAHQRVTIMGEKGRIEVMIPFNAPIDRPTEIAIDSGADLLGGGRRVEKFPVCDQYTLQGDAFSRAIVDDAPLEFPIEDAIANMRRHRRPVPLRESGAWEKP